jgi:hypothetical protein
MGGVKGYAYMTTEQWLLVFAGISATADFLAILRVIGIGNAVEGSEVRTPRKLAKRNLILPVLLFALTMGILGYVFYRTHDIPLSPTEWMEARKQYTEVFNHTFGPDDVVELDGKNIHDNHFISSTIVYRGKLPFYWNHNTMEGKMRFKFVDGPAQQAAAMVHFAQTSLPCMASMDACSYEAVDENLNPMPPHP